MAQEQKGISIVDTLVTELTDQRLVGTVRLAGVRWEYDSDGVDWQYYLYIAPEEPQYDPSKLNEWILSFLPAAISPIPPQYSRASYLAGSRPPYLSIAEFKFEEVAGKKIFQLRHPKLELLTANGGERFKTPDPEEVLKRYVQVLVYPHTVLSNIAAHRGAVPYSYDSGVVTDLRNGYVKKEWLDRLERREDPFNPPNFFVRNWRELTGYYDLRV